MTVSRSERAAARLDQAIVDALTALDNESQLVLKARVAKMLAERCRGAQYEFGERRTEALIALREEEDWSLADMKAEFGISRARLSAMINREERAERRKEDQKKYRSDR